MADVAQTTQDTRRGRGRPKVVDDLTIAARIVDAAGDIFLASGYDDTTMDMVARRAGMSKRTVYRLFTGKQALFAAVVASHRQSMLDLPREDDDRPLFESLMAIFRTDLDLETLTQRDAVMRLIITEAQRHPELAPLLHRYGPLQARQLLSEWLVRQVALGRMVIDEPRWAAHFLLQMTFGPIAFGDDGKPQWPAPAERKSHVARAADIFLHGVVPRDPSARR
jgi:AcrR family transcriptional regulator